jgi:hypothetical protein
MAARVGIVAVAQVRFDNFDSMEGIKGNLTVAGPLEPVNKETKRVDPRHYTIAKMAMILPS